MVVVIYPDSLKDKLSSQSKIRHLAFIRLFAREEYRSKYITGANRFTIIHVVARWHHHLYLCHCMKFEVNNINSPSSAQATYIQTRCILTTSNRCKLA